MQCLIIAASHRKESFNQKLANLTVPLFEKENIDISFPHYQTFDLPLFNAQQHEEDDMPEALEAIAQTIANADMLLIATPEYNWSYPASIKNLIDWLSLKPDTVLQGKPIMIMCATPSIRGGMLAMQHLRVPLEALGARVFPEFFALGKADEAFSSDNTLNNKEKTTRLRQTISAYIQFSKALHHVQKSE